MKDGISGSIYLFNNSYMYNSKSPAQHVEEKARGNMPFIACATCRDKITLPYCNHENHFTLNAHRVVRGVGTHLSQPPRPRPGNK